MRTEPAERQLTKKESWQQKSGVHHRARLVASTTLALALMTLVSPSSATASPSPAKIQPTSQMAAQILEFPLTVEVGAMGHDTLAPTDVRTGDCGSSYLLLDPIPRGFRIRTGFSVIEPVASYSWSVDGYGPTGFRETFTGGPSGPDVDLIRSVGRLAPGEYDVIVTEPSHVVLANGTVCGSLNPAETKPVF